MKSSQPPAKAPVAGNTLPRVKSISALQRGLEVLALIQAAPGMSLHGLHARSAVPKASLLRIARTLEEAGLILRRTGDQGYVPAERAAAVASPRGVAAGPLPDVAARCARALREQLDWPSDIAVRHGLRMRVIESNRALFGAMWKRRVTGAEVDMQASALGRAYLAFCPETERGQLLDELAQARPASLQRREYLQKVLAATRRCGYGARDASYAGPDAQADSVLSAIAVPVFVGPRVVACISCVWSLHSADFSTVMARSLGPLVRQACEMGYALSEDQDR